MKKTKIFLLITMIFVLTLTAILPSFALDYSPDANNNAECLLVFNARGATLQYSYNNDRGAEFFSTNGDVLILKAPKVRARYHDPNAPTTNVTYTAQEADYYVYFNADDNTQLWTVKIYDPNNDAWSTYDCRYLDLYVYKTDTRVPILYTDSIQDMIVTTYNAQAPDKSYWLPFWDALRLSSDTAYIIPSKYSYIVQQGNTPSNDALNQAYEQGKADGYEEGKQESVYTDRDSFIDLIQAIFTAPGYLINSIFDFELFGFNMANVIRALFTLTLVGVVIMIFVKFL